MVHLPIKLLDMGKRNKSTNDDSLCKADFKTTSNDESLTSYGQVSGSVTLKER